MNLRAKALKLRQLLTKHDGKVVTIVAAILATVSVVRYFRAGDILAYGDAESHINIAKRVTGSLTPGFGQLGGIWLPLHHLLMVPFVINDYMWHTGLGGAIVSALSYVASVYFVYKLAKILFDKPWVAPVATAIYALNPNVLYMLATPMSELPLLAFLTGSTYYFIKWLQTDAVHLLVLTGFLSFCGVLVRYDAWFLILIQAVTVVVVGWQKRWAAKKIEGTAVLLTVPAIFGVVLWVLWCLLIFKNPLYFLNSPYSAKSQQQSFLNKGELPTYHHLFTSITYYSQAIIDNVGWLFAGLALVGAVVLIAQRTKKQVVSGVIILAILFATFFFNVLSLYLGISILFIPELTPANFEFHLFNIRYGMMMIPAVALLIGMLLNRLSISSVRRGAILLVAAVCVAFTFTYPVTLRDGKTGLSSRNPTGSTDTIETVFQQHYDYGYVAFDDFSRAATPIALGIPMNKIIYIGTHPYWENMLKQPNRYARYLILRHNIGDTLWTHLQHSPAFKYDYSVVAQKGDVYLYKCQTSCVGNVNLTKQM